MFLVEELSCLLSAIYINFDLVLDDHNRVKLSQDDDGNGYINASFVVSLLHLLLFISKETKICVLN